MSHSGSRSPREEPTSEREELTAGIEQTRQELAETVEALAAKADVPTRVRGKATELGERVTGTLTTLSQTVRERPGILYAAAGVLTAAGVWVWLKRRS
jgi:hypothetical protein